MHYSLETIERIPQEEIIRLIHIIDPNYKSVNDRQDRYHLAKLAQEFNQLDSYDDMNLNNPDFMRLYLMSNNQLIRTARDILGPCNVQSQTRIDLIHRILSNRGLLNLAFENVMQVSSYLPAESLFNISQTQIGTSLSHTLTQMTKSVEQLFLDRDVDEIIRRVVATVPVFDLPCLQTAIMQIINRKSKRGSSILIHAALTGNLPLVQWLQTVIQEGKEKYSNVISNAARSGNLKLVQWLQSQGYYVNSYGVMSNAIRSGNFELVQWLHTQGAPLDYYDHSYRVDSGLVMDAIDSGNLELVQWLQVQAVNIFKRDNFRIAGRSGSLPIVQLFVANGADITNSDFLRTSIQSGNIQLLE